MIHFAAYVDNRDVHDSSPISSHICLGGGGGGEKVKGEGREGY